MKRISLVLQIILAALLLSSAGCNKGSAKVDATKSLEQSFQAASPEVKQAIQAINACLRAGNYVEATSSMATVVSSDSLTSAQKQAIGLLLQQINQAVAANPNLDSAEFFKKRQALFDQVYHAPGA